MDALSDVLGAIRLTGAVFLQMELRAQWSYLTAPARAIADVLMPDAADHVIPYHLLLEGTCFARLLDGEFVQLGPGDLVMFPAGDRHVLATASDVSRHIAPTEITGESLSFLKRNEIVPFRVGDSGHATRIVCGYLACDKRLAEPIIGKLPRLLNVSLRDGNAAAWVRTSIQYSVAQSASKRPGSAMVLARLSEVLFAEAIRQHVETLSPEETGWLAALRDRHIGRTLALLHDKPAHPWTVDELARKVGLSRSALGHRFVALIGKPPMEYLMRWRILLAARHLRESRSPVIQIAAEVGYESEAAFNRAFKRELGVPPAAWRRQAATA
jgi:AraC family transcriptional regulator, alkane utilization regulator